MRQDSVLLYCRACSRGFGTIGKVPPTCPSCGAGPVGDALEWWTLQGPPDVPKQPYTLSENDKVFMRDRGIKRDDEPSKCSG